MADLKISRISTSTIGSFPLEDSATNRTRCLKDLLDIGIDFPTYPQLADMGKQFLDDLAAWNSGIVIENGHYRLKGKEIICDAAPLGLEPFFWTLRYLEERSLKDSAKLKAAITGPFTLASRIETRTGVFPFSTALADSKLVKQLAAIIGKSCETASKDALMISIDEPILGVIVGARIAFGYRVDDIVRIYNTLTEACKGKYVGTHICGRISPNLAKILLKTRLDFLSHEFSDTPENVGIYRPQELKDSGKILSVGCVSSRNPRLENPEEILSVMKKFLKYQDSLIFTPDCGFRNLIVEGSKEKGYEISVRKLKNMVEATEKLRAAE